MLVSDPVKCLFIQTLAVVTKNIYIFAFFFQTENATEIPAAKAHKRVQIKHESLLNESGLLNKMPIRDVESPRPEPNNATQ